MIYAQGYSPRIMWWFCLITESKICDTGNLITKRKKFQVRMSYKSVRKLNTNIPKKKVFFFYQLFLGNNMTIRCATNNEFNKPTHKHANASKARD